MLLPAGALGDNNNYRDVVDADEGRTYQIRRRINANGDEQVHRIRTDDWWSGEDDSDSVFPTGSSTIAGGRRSIPERLPDGVARGQFPPQPVYEPPNVGSPSSGAPDVGRFSRRTSRYQVRQPSEASVTAQSTATNSAPVTTRRRRGWARINPDGDEIPTDEEEEAERVREQRLRNGQSVFNSAFPSSTRARLAYLPPTTRNGMSPWTDDGEDTGPTRIGLNLPTAQAHRRVQQLANSDQETSPLRSEKDTDQDMEYFGTSETYYVCPLPTPLAQVSSAPVSAHRKSSRVKGLFVSRESELAAR
ncbi:hypothetical protein DFH11DRAFT_71577 [Phellopilus nigrolimitatus]|nr:hypothetical protein DFH11DRAFT_71577 [Phellopilus nigrolimitatus]